MTKTAGQDRNVEQRNRIGGLFVVLGTPRRLPKPGALVGRVVVLDIAFASESAGRQDAFDKMTLRFIEALGPRLVGWVDHHDSAHHARFAHDGRFVLATKAQHGACPEMITPELVSRIGSLDTVVCHGDFDGLASAAKWIRGGQEPYPGCDDDARAIDTRVGVAGPLGTRFDRALRARPRDTALALVIVEQLASGLEREDLWAPIDRANGEHEALEARARALVGAYQVLPGGLAFLEVTDDDRPYDKTLLLLLGQERARMAVLVHGDTVTFAAPFDSGINFLERFGLSGGMPTLVSLNRARLREALVALGVPDAQATRLATAPGVR